MRSVWLKLLVFCFASLPAAAQINPHTNIRWPPGCLTANMVYSQFINNCVNVTGTAANPAGGTKQVQYNLGGAFAASTGFSYDPVTNILTVPSFLDSDMVGVCPAGDSSGHFVKGAACVVCTGTNDTAALNTALAGAGTVVIAPGTTCVLNATGTSHLTIPSRTHIKAYGASVSYNGGGAGTDYLIGNTQVARTIARTCTDVVMTVNSNAITSATCGFTQADVQNTSISCIGGITPGGLAWATAAMGSDLHTTITNVTSATAAYVADPPSAVSNPMTCNIYSRDTDISIEGGTWTSTSGSTQGPSIIKIVTANNVTLRDLNLVDNSSTVPSSGTGFQIYPADLSNYLFENITLGGWNQGNDGIHLLGPARSGTERHIRGHSGDDMLPVFSADGNMGGGSNAQIEGRVYGVIDGLLIDDVDGSSYAMEAAVKIAAPTGVSIPIKNVTIRHVHGSSPNCPVGCQAAANQIGFGNGVFIFSGGGIDNIKVEDVGGYILGSPVLLGTGAQATSVVVGSLKAVDLHQEEATFNANPLLELVNGPVVSNLEIDGLKSGTYNQATSVLIDVTSTVKQLIINDVQFSNMIGGAFVPFQLNGTFNSVMVSNVQLVYNTGTATVNNGIFDFHGAKANRVSLDHVHVSYQGGSLVGGLAMVYIDTYQPGSITPAIVDLVTNDTSIIAPAPLTQYLLFSANSAFLATYNITNAKLNNVSGCIFGGLPAVGNLTNLTSSNLSAASTCQVFSSGLASVLATVSLVNQSASISQTVFYTSTVANEMVQFKCSLYTGTTTGTGTVSMILVWDSGTNFVSSGNLTLSGPGASVDLNPVLVEASAGKTFKYGTTYTAGTGGSYNLTCALVRYQ